jgi:hypothetical protein
MERNVHQVKLFGRSILVQAYYYGRLRYWAYSLLQSKKVIGAIQKDADILHWARHPVLREQQKGESIEKSTQRTRGWVARATAIGPKSKGGVNLMDWKLHIESFLAEWVFRYVAPGEAEWKKIWDEYVLKDKQGKTRYPEGRTVVFQNLSVRQKAKIISSFPKGAKYAKACLRAFWALRITPQGNQGIASESPWYSHRVQLNVY